MAAAASKEFDQISLSSSCEEVDVLSEAVQDQQHVLLVQQPPPHGHGSMHTPQVSFTCMKESYSLSRNLEVQFKYTHNIKEGGFGDRVGLYQLPKTQLHQHVAFVWTNGRDGWIVLDRSVLPVQEGEYLLQYLQGDNTVVGTSHTFQMISDDVTVIGVAENNLAMGEEEKQDLAELSYWKELCEELSENNAKLKKKEGSLRKMLEKEEDEKVKLLNKNTEMLVKLEDLSKHCKDVVRSKDTAVKELRTLIEQEDRVRQELAELKEEYGDVEAELVTVKQEMVQIKEKMNDEDSMNFEEKMRGLLTNLDIHQRFLKEANEYVVELEEDKGELTKENTKMKLKLREMQIIEKSMKQAVALLEKDKIELENRFTCRNNNNAKTMSELNQAQCQENLDHMLSLEEQVKVLNEELIEKLSKVAEEERQKKMRCDIKAEVPEINQLAIDTEEISSLRLVPGTDHVEDAPAPVIPLPSPSPLTSPSLPAPVDNDLECPLCDDTFPADQVTELVNHVEQHMKNMLECPVCNMMFDRRDQELFQDHVHFHFQPQNQGAELEDLTLAAGGWDLGFE